MISAMFGTAQPPTAAVANRSDDAQVDNGAFHLLMSEPQQNGPEPELPCCDDHTEAAGDQALMTPVSADGTEAETTPHNLTRRWTSTESMIRSAASGMEQGIPLPQGETDSAPRFVTGPSAALTAGADAEFVPLSGRVVERRVAQDTQLVSDRGRNSGAEDPDLFRKPDIRSAAMQSTALGSALGNGQNSWAGPVPSGHGGRVLQAPVPSILEPEKRVAAGLANAQESGGRLLVPHPPIGAEALQAGRPSHGWPTQTQAIEGPLLRALSGPGSSAVIGDSAVVMSSLQAAGPTASRMAMDPGHARHTLQRGESPETVGQVRVQPGQTVMHPAEAVIKTALRGGPDAGMPRPEASATETIVPYRLREPVATARPVPSVPERSQVAMHPAETVLKADPRSGADTGMLRPAASAEVTSMPGRQREPGATARLVPLVQERSPAAMRPAETIRKAAPGHGPDAGLLRPAASAEVTSMPGRQREPAPARAVPPVPERFPVAVHPAETVHKAAPGHGPDAWMPRPAASADVTTVPDRRGQFVVPARSVSSPQAQHLSSESDAPTKAMRKPEVLAALPGRDVPALPVPPTAAVIIPGSEDDAPVAATGATPTAARRQLVFGAPSQQRAENDGKPSIQAMAVARGDGYPQRSGPYPTGPQESEGPTLSVRDATPVSVPSGLLPAADGPLQAEPLSGNLPARNWPVPVRPDRLVAQLRIPIMEAMSFKTKSSIQVAFDPVELGRVRLTLTPTESGMQVQIIAERAESLDLLRRFSTDLIRDLREMGFNDVDMQFSQQGGNGSAFGSWQAQAPKAPLADPSQLTDLASPTRIADQRKGVDLRL